MSSSQAFLRPRNEEFDVVVVGFGFAGASAAIAAHDAGARVAIVEKMPHGGGNSRVSGGNCVISDPEPSAVLATTDYLHRLCFETTDRSVVAALVEGSLDLVDWFASLGARLSVPEKLIISSTYPRTLKGPGFPMIAPQTPVFKKYCIEGDAAVAPSMRMWRVLETAVNARDITVFLDTPVDELLTDQDGAVAGVASKKAELNLHARTTVLTCGGFENDATLLREYATPADVKFAGNPGNTGDGIRLVQQVGGNLWHMSRTSCIIGFQSEEYDAAFGIFFPHHGFVYLDCDAHRFSNETDIELHEFHRILTTFDTDRVRFPRIPTWAVFNEATRLAGPITWWSSGYNRDLYQWSAENSAEIEKGWIISADSIPQLAESTGLPAEELEATLSQYNSTCDEGHADVFGRSPQTLERIDGPFYAIPLHPVVLNTQGGAQRDAAARVLSSRGKPIVGLYSAGEFGSAWGYLYQGATNITECLSVGRTAGRNAAQFAGTH